MKKKIDIIVIYSMLVFILVKDYIHILDKIQILISFLFLFYTILSFIKIIKEHMKRKTGDGSVPSEEK